MKILKFLDNYKYKYFQIPFQKRENLKNSNKNTMTHFHFISLQLQVSHYYTQLKQEFLISFSFSYFHFIFPCCYGSLVHSEMYTMWCHSAFCTEHFLKDSFLILLLKWWKGYIGKNKVCCVGWQIKWKMLMNDTLFLPTIL